MYGNFRNLYLAARNFPSVALEGVDAAAVFVKKKKMGGGKGDCVSLHKICACPSRWPWKVWMQCVCVCVCVRARAHELEGEGEE